MGKSDEERQPNRRQLAISYHPIQIFIPFFHMMSRSLFKVLPKVPPGGATTIAHRRCVGQSRWKSTAFGKNEMDEISPRDEINKLSTKMDTLASLHVRAEILDFVSQYQQRNFVLFLLADLHKDGQGDEQESDRGSDRVRGTHAFPLWRCHHQSSSAFKYRH